MSSRQASNLYLILSNSPHFQCRRHLSTLLCVVESRILYQIGLAEISSLRKSIAAGSWSRCCPLKSGQLHNMVHSWHEHAHFLRSCMMKLLVSRSWRRDSNGSVASADIQSDIFTKGSGFVSYRMKFPFCPTHHIRTDLETDSREGGYVEKERPMPLAPFIYPRTPNAVRKRCLF